MATSSLSKAIRQICRNVLSQDANGLTDAQLLERFISLRDEVAVAAIVRRHGPMVWAVCRRVLQNYHDAEDAFQATFLVFVRKATSIVSKEMLANWLYGVAHQTALDGKKMANKRRERERPTNDIPEPRIIASVRTHELEVLLDRELSRLPDKYRIAIVLCDLEGRTRKEAARHLKIPEGTFSTRLMTARTMLAKRLIRHGVGATGASIMSILSHQMVMASVPTSVMYSTIKAASSIAAGKATSLISTNVAALTERVVKSMLLTKFKTVTAILASCIVVLTSAMEFSLVFFEIRRKLRRIRGMRQHDALLAWCGKSY